MAQNTPILGKIKSSESAASLDAKYGPYASKAAANAALGENGDDVITAGLTVGVTQSDGSVKEFWYQPDGQGGLQLVEKQTASIEVDSELSSTSENPVQNKVVKSALDAKGTYSKPSEGIPKTDLASGVQTSLGKADTALQQHQDLSGKVDKVANAQENNFASFDANGGIKDSTYKAGDFATAAQGAKADNAIPMPIGTDGQILEKDSNETSGVKWVPKPSDGKSAYQIAVDNGFVGSESEWLASLKAQFGSFVPADYGTDGKPASGGTDITASASTTNYIYLVDNAASDPTAKVMWITVVNDSVTPNTYSWQSIGDVQVNLLFKSGQSLDNVNIVKDLTTGGIDDVLSAEQGKVLGNEVFGEYGFAEVPLEIPSSGYYVYSNGGVAVSRNTTVIVRGVRIPCNPGDVFKIYGSDGTDMSAVRLYIFSDGTDVNGTYTVVEGGLADNNIDTRQNGLVITAPEGSVYLTMNFYNYNSESDHLQKWQKTVDGLSDKTEELIEQTQYMSDELANMSVFSEALKGVSFGSNSNAQLLKGIIKAVSVNVIDPNFTSTSLYLSMFRNTSNLSNAFVLRLTDASNNMVVQFSNTSKYSGLQTLVSNGYGNYADQLIFTIVIDFPADNINMATVSGVEIDLTKVNKYLTPTKSMSEQVYSNTYPLQGKTIVCFGDSLTMRRDADGLSYADYIAQYSGANVINVGVGGAQIRQRTIPTLTPTSVTEAYAAIDIYSMVHAACTQNFDLQDASTEYLSDSEVNYRRAKKSVYRLKEIDWNTVDVVTVLGGTNDWGTSGVNAGTSGSDNPSYTLGAINKIIQELLETYPKLSIYWFSPVVHWAENGNRTVANWGDNDNPSGTIGTLKQWAAMIENEVVLQHIPCCDLYNTMGWNMYNFAQYFAADGSHPDKGYKEMGKKMTAFILANLTF